MERISGKLVTTKSKNAGIYAIINLNNNKFYIGSSNNLHIRRNSHFAKLRSNKHSNPYLQNAYNIDSNYFIMVEIETIDDLSILRDREQFWLDHFKTYERNIGYNINRFTDSMLGYKHSPETRVKLRKAHLGRKLPDEQKRRISESGKGRIVSKETKRKISESNTKTKLSKEFKLKHEEKATSVIQLDKEGNIIKIWKRIKEAANHLGLQSSNIVHCCKGKRKTAGGFKWAYNNK